MFEKHIPQSIKDEIELQKLRQVDIWMGVCTLALVGFTVVNLLIF